MASEYDALLAPPPDQKSEYDALLAPPAPPPTATVAPSSLTEAIFGKANAQAAVDYGQQQGAPSIPELAATERTFSQEHPYLYGVAKGVAGMVPTSLDQVKQMVTLPRPSAFETKDLPESEQLGEAWRGEHGPTEQAAALTGTALQALPLVGLPFAKSPLRATPRDLAIVEQFRPKLTEDIFGKTEAPPIQEPTAPIISEQVASEVLPTEPTEAKLTEVNRELASVTEPPEATVVAPEPFPSVSRSAEEQRRTELQQPAEQPVRQAISLDELRLMRERNELQLQNDLSKRATGTTHPAVDERLSQIDEELTNIANRELQTEGGGEVKSATQERVIEESGVPEYQGNGEIGTPTKTSSRGSVEPSAEVAGQETVANVPSEQPIEERVQPGQFGTEGYTAIPTKKPPIQVSGDEPHVSAIANRFTEERAAKGELGEIVPGQGYSTQELVQHGLKMSPEEVTQHVSDLMQGGGDPIKQGMAVRAEEARLSQRSAQLSKVADANPQNVESKLAADSAFKDLQDFHNGPVARLKQNWHAQGMGLQGELPVDLSTFNGLREAWLKDTGEAPPPSVEPTLRRTAQKVATSVADENGAMTRLGQEIEKQTARVKLPTAEEVRNNISERLKQMPCPV